ncbi:type II secretion system protein [Methylibium sp.]|uniref:type II secretion system protein n=1 Tax=Methylibium sp. TaxID=2067992 RepID=UPI003D1373A3
MARTRTRLRPRAAGFSYVGVMFLVALLGITSAVASTLWSVVAQRERERELLFIGRQYRAALERYAAGAPLVAPAGGLGGAPPAAPTSLEQLLRDPRVPFTRRFLRQLYPDPMTGKAEWGLVLTPQGGIVGIYSLSQKKPLKKAGFAPREAFAAARSYRDWVFGSDDAVRGAAVAAGAGLPPRLP